MKRVLILNDDREAAEKLAHQLAALGLEATAVTSPQGALERMQAGGVDVLVTGPRAGGRPGTDLIRIARRVSPSTRSLLVGADVAREVKVAMEHGAVDVLPSPFTGHDLVQAVRKALECEQGFRGTIHGLSLLDLLWMAHHARRSMVVQFGPEAAIHMFEGEIIHAVAPPLFGVDALGELLAVQSGCLTTAPFDDCVATIQQRFEALMRECHISQRPPARLPSGEFAALPPLVAKPPRRRSGIGMIFATAVVMGLAIGALLLFLLAPHARLTTTPEVGLPDIPLAPVTAPLEDVRPVDPPVKDNKTL